VCVCVWVRVCVGVCVCVRERERERDCVCAYVCVSAHACVRVGVSVCHNRGSGLSELNGNVASQSWGFLPEGPQVASLVRLFSRDDVVQHHSEGVNIDSKARGMGEAHELRSHVCRGASLCHPTPHCVSIHTVDKGTFLAIAILTK
jgi:hypothetical protein